MPSIRPGRSQHAAHTIAPVVGAPHRLQTGGSIRGRREAQGEHSHVPRAPQPAQRGGKTRSNRAVIQPFHLVASRLSSLL